MGKPFQANIFRQRFPHFVIFQLTDCKDLATAQNRTKHLGLPGVKTPKASTKVTAQKTENNLISQILKVKIYQAGSPMLVQYRIIGFF